MTRCYVSHQAAGEYNGAGKVFLFYRVTSFVLVKYQTQQPTVEVASRETVANFVASRQTLLILKAFIAYFIAFVFVLMHPENYWLGRRCYIAPFAELLHHPCRTVGSQIEISIFSIAGAAIGMGWAVWRDIWPLTPIRAIMATEGSTLPRYCSHYLLLPDLKPTESDCIISFSTLESPSFFERPLM